MKIETYFDKVYFFPFAWKKVLLKANGVEMKYDFLTLSALRLNLSANPSKILPLNKWKTDHINITENDKGERKSLQRAVKHFRFFTSHIIHLNTTF